MMKMLSLSNRMLVPALFLVAATAGCGPSKPVTGAPVRVEVDKVNADSLDVRLYNFSDKTVAGYSFLIRYLDGGGAVIKNNMGRDFSSWSVSGMKYKCASKEWCSFKLDGFQPPKGAAKAEALVSSVDSVAADGASLDQKSLFSLPYTSTWPTGPSKS